MLTQILTILGGLAVFLYGMQIMGDGLKNAAGQRMRSVLALFAKNRVIAVTTGTIVTAVIQSSSATTVMVVGFVNAGLLTLVQAVGIICGSHIGTTITGQLVAFKISWLIMPAIIIGLILYYMPKRSWANWGLTIMGFGFVFLGMEFMGDKLKELSQTEAITNIFRTFCCQPENGIMPFGATMGALAVGIVATIVIQSSSATSGVAIVLATSGLLDFYTATVIVLGAAIGTTITAQIAAARANRVAKQAAMAHTLISTMGVTLCVASFWITWDGEPVFFKIVHLCSPGATIGREIANANTIYNVVFTIAFIPFIPLIAKTCEIILPVDRREVKFQRLEPHLLDTPSIALAQTSAALRKMLKKSWRMVDTALRIYNKNDEANQRIVKQLEAREADVDARQQDIADYLAKLMQRQLTSQQAKQIPMLLHCTNDVERIGDHTAIIRGIMEHLKTNKLAFSKSAEEEFNSLHANLTALAIAVIGLLEKKSPESIEEAKKMKKQLISQLTTYEADHLTRISSGLCVPEVGIMYLDLLEEIRKVTHHLSNITDRADNFYEKLAKLGKVDRNSATSEI